MGNAGFPDYLPEQAVSQPSDPGYRLLNGGQGKNVAVPREARYALLVTDVRDFGEPRKVADGWPLGGQAG